MKVLTGVIFFISALVSFQSSYAQNRALGVNDTIAVATVVYDGDTLIARQLPGVYVYAYGRHRNAEWTRLRNAVYVTYPYALRASAVFNDINAHLAGKTDKFEIHNYIVSREKELKKEFTTPITNLSIYQGKILMKLINRETGNNVYDILKEFKGGFVARFWQTVAFFFDSNLKQPYNPKGEDAEMEKIVQEVRRLYGYRS
jgi:hypothetical protein